MAGHSVAFSPNGALLAAGGDDGLIWLWDVATGQVSAIFGGYPNGVTSLAFSAGRGCTGSG